MISLPRKRRFGAREVARLAAIVLAPILWIVALAESRAERPPDAITGIRASSDGRYLAMVTESGQLSVLDFSDSTPTTVFTPWARDGFDWAPGRSELAYVDRPPGRPATLDLRSPGESSPRRLIDRGFDWLAQPTWLDARRLLFRSDRESNHVNVWMLDVESGQSKRVVDAGADVTGVWASPARDEFVFALARPGATELHWTVLESGQSVRIASGAGVRPLPQSLVAFTPRGDRVFFVLPGEGSRTIVHFDTRKRRELGRLESPTEPSSLSVLRGDTLLFTAGGNLLSWRPGAILGRSVTKPENWNGLPLTDLAATPEGFGAVLDGGSILHARAPDEVERGIVRARSADDVIRSTLALARPDLLDRGPALLATLEAYRPADARERARLLLARAWLERLTGSRDRCERLLQVASETPGLSEEERRQIWLERLMLAFAEREDRGRARGVILAMPQNAYEDPLSQWIERLIDAEPEDSARGWQRACVALRSRDFDRGVRQIRGLFQRAPGSRVHRGGAALAVLGGLEPLASVVSPSSRPLDPLLDHGDFQLALRSAAAGDPGPYATREEFRGTLILQWARRGAIEPARRLVEADLRDPEGPVIDYMDMIVRYLDPDEREPWVERAIGDVLLDAAVVPLLEEWMEDPRARVALELARCKTALSRVEIEPLRESLGRLDATIAELSEDFRREAPELLFYHALYRAKYEEIRGDWPAALAGYDDAAETMRSHPADWGVAAFDAAAARSLVETGAEEPERLGRHLELVREMGDPLVAPARDPERLDRGVSSLASQGESARGTWLEPAIALAAGASLAVVERPYQAVAYLSRGRALQPPPDLLARMLFEEAAARASLGQYRLAAELLAELCRLPLDPPRMTVAIKARADAEKESGFVFSREDRLRGLCAELRLPPAWVRALIGTEDEGAHQLVLPPPVLP